MDKLPVPPLLDLGRLIGSNLLETAANLRLYYNDRGQFNYRAALDCALALCGGLPLQAAITACMRRGAPAGRLHNVEVVKIIYQVAAGRLVSCYDFPSMPYVFRHDLSTRLPVRSLIIERGHPKFPIFQPRRTFNPSIAGLGLIGSVLRDSIIKDDFASADIELVDMSLYPGTKQRRCDIYSLEKLPLLPEAELQARLQLFADAYDLLIREEFRPKARPTRRKDVPPSLV